MKVADVSLQVFWGHVGKFHAYRFENTFLKLQEAFMLFFQVGQDLGRAGQLVVVILVIDKVCHLLGRGALLLFLAIQVPLYINLLL